MKTNENLPTIPFTKAGSPRSTTHVRMRNSRSRLQRTPIMDHSQTSEIHSHNARPKSQSQRTTIEIREEERKMRGAEVYSGGRRGCLVGCPWDPDSDARRVRVKTIGRACGPPSSWAPGLGVGLGLGLGRGNGLGFEVKVRVRPHARVRVRVRVRVGGRKRVRI